MNKGLQRNLRRLFLFGLALQSLSLAALLAISVISTDFLKSALAEALAGSVRKSLVIGDYREAILGLESVVTAHFRSVVYFGSDGQPVFSIPASLDQDQDQDRDPGRARRRSNSMISYRVGDSGSLVFAYDRFHLLPQAVGIWMAALGLSFPLFRRARRQLIERFELEKEKEREALLARVAAQVAHDIRSPIAALNAVLPDLAGLPGETRDLVRLAIQRIRDIAEDLLQKGRAERPARTGGGRDILSRGEARKSREVAAESQPIALLLEEGVGELRPRLRDRRGISLECELDGREALRAFARVDGAGFRRVLSNLLNNAVEAIEGPSGKVAIALGIDPRDGDDAIEIRITDTGRGIPAELLGKLGRRAVTHGKPGGSGLGLAHAKGTVESWGGRLSIASEGPGRGASVTLSLPSCAAPEWFVGELTVSEGVAAVIVDDDPAIHRLWERRLADRKRVHFDSLEPLRRWYLSGEGDGPFLFLMDHEFEGFTRTGLDSIEDLGIGAQSVLVTGRYDDPGVRDRCRKAGARLLPKPLIARIAIRG